MATDKSESEIEDVSVSSKTSGPSLKETLSGFITTPFSSVLVLHVKDHHYAYVFTQHTQYVEPEVTSNATVKRGRGRAKPRSVPRSRGTSGGSVPKVSGRKTYPLRFASRKASISQGL
ncbi:hypothetical protein GBAR_LOCUS28756 [Geodia barretti]|nr:hypothetical protein GBAR_LOCUS28756 [Geodia barretti]